MPIHRYEGAGVWARLKNIYRYEGAGVWGRMKAVFRYEGAGVWGRIFSALGDIVATTNPTFRNGVNIDPDPNTTGSLFTAGQDLTLTRGAYTEDSVALPNTTSIKYELKIFRKAVSSISESYSEDLTTWDEITGSTVNFLGNAGSTASSSTFYTVTNVDANINGAGQGYRFAGRVRVTTNANDAVPDWTNFRIIHQYGVARINFNISSFTASNFTQNGATFAWQVSGLPATNTNSYIYNQKLEVKRNSDGVVVYTQDNISPGTNGATTIVVSDISILASTQHYATITVTANDPWKTSNWPNNAIRNTLVFSTTGSSPANTISPVISPLNNRSRAPVNTQLSSSTGTWTNVQSGATYQYQWTYDDGNTPYYFPSSSTWTSANTFSGIPTSFAANGSVTVKVKVTNPDGGFGITQNPNSYLLDPAVSYNSSQVIAPTNANPNVSTTFNFPTISGYPTSYAIDWGDGTAQYASGSITANTSSVSPSVAHTYTTGGSYTLKITAQPGNVQLQTTVTVANPIATIESVSNRATDVGYITLFYTATPDIEIDQFYTFATRYHPTYGNQTTSGVYWSSTNPNVSSEDSGKARGWNYIYVGDKSDYSNSLYSWIAYVYPVRNTVLGTPATISVNTTGSNSQSPTSTVGTPSVTSTSFTNTVTFGGSTNAYTLDVRTGSYSGTSISGYPIQNQTGNISVSGLSNGTTYYVIVTPYYYYYTDPDHTSVNPSNSVRLAGPTAAFTATTTTPLTKLNTPTGVAASDNRTDGINVTWNPVSGAAYYGVWYGPPAPSYDSLADFGGNRNTSLITGTSYLDTSMGSGVTRDYYVQAYRSGDPSLTKSEWGGPDSGTRVAPVSQYTVTWNATANGGTGGGTSGPLNAGSTHTAPSASKAGSTLNGWYTSTSGGTLRAGDGGSYVPTQSETLYAQYTASSCTCSYSDQGTYYYSPGCCTPTTLSGLPTVYNNGNSVCTNCYTLADAGGCCNNINKRYTKCSANDVTNPSSPVYFYCYSTGQCINSTQGAGGSC